MNKFQLLILSVLLFFSFFYRLEVKAEENSTSSSDLIELNCPPAIIKGSRFLCTVEFKGNSEKIEGIQFNYEFASGISYIETLFQENWQGLAANSSGVAMVVKDKDTSSSIISQINLISSEQLEEGESFEIKLKNIQVSDGTENISLGDKIAKIDISSITDVITSLKVNDSVLEIRDGVFNYYVDVAETVDKVVVEAELKDKTYQFLSNYGPRTINNLQEGENEIQLQIGMDDTEFPLAIYNMNETYQVSLSRDIASNEHITQSNAIKKYKLDRLTPKIMHSQILKKGHHGYKTSTSVGFLSDVNASAIITTSGNYTNHGYYNVIPYLENISEDRIFQYFKKTKNIQITSNNWKSYIYAPARKNKIYSQSGITEVTTYGRGWDTSLR